jgi:hypothetical protein
MIISKDIVEKMDLDYTKMPFKKKVQILDTCDTKEPKDKDGNS